MCSYSSQSLVASCLERGLGALTSQGREIHQMRAVLWRRWDVVSGQQLTLPTALSVDMLAQYWDLGETLTASTTGAYLAEEQINP